MQLLLLTKVPLYEENFERQLKQLGNEVYCSSNMLTMLKRNSFDKAFLTQFEGIIFSETIYDIEAYEVIKQLPQANIKLFRRAADSNFDKEGSSPF
ncbi:hypothetical protein ABW365_24875 [Enterococcus avium]